MFKATPEDFDRVKLIVSEELESRCIEVDTERLIQITFDVLNTAYSIGGGYDENTVFSYPYWIRDIIVDFV